jgi:hypothetical protein
VKAYGPSNCSEQPCESSATSLRTVKSVCLAVSAALNILLCGSTREDGCDVSRPGLSALGVEGFPILVNWCSRL